jgi:hypothetical protein
MDDELFSDMGLQGTLVGPKSATFIDDNVRPIQQNHNLVAEPAQVMVLVPKQREAVTELKLLKQKLYLFALIVVLLFAVYVWYKLKRWWNGPSVPEQVHVLPGPHTFHVKEIATEPVKEFVTQERSYEPKESIRVHESIPNVRLPSKDDIVEVHGPIPVWSWPEDVPTDNETKVSDTTASIEAMIKQREEFTKQLEKEISESLKKAQQ